MPTIILCKRANPVPEIIISVDMDEYKNLDSTSVLQKHNQSLDKYAFLRNSAFTHWVKEKCSKIC